jgi:hypothetical protein
MSNYDGCVTGQDKKEDKGERDLYKTEFVPLLKWK